MGISSGLYVALLVSGLAGSLGHCLGMCGPLVIMAGLQFGERHWTGILPRYLLYHGARITVYAVLGSIAGAIGSLLGMGKGLGHLTGWISLFLGIGVILFAMRYTGWLPLGRFEGGGNWISSGMRQALRRGGLWGAILLGTLNGLLPCGLVYSALLLAASTGHAFSGAFSMFIFGTGTIPALLSLGLGARFMSVNARQAFSKVAGFLIMATGLQLVLRGSAGLGLLSHWMIGEFMVW